jgi:uncharacterized protein YjbJ (UPF0337 family)
MADENEKTDGAKEKLKAIGQEVVGEIELIGGILTADPITQAEGEFNVETGTLRQKTTKVLDKSEESTDDSPK